MSSNRPGAALVAVALLVVAACNPTPSTAPGSPSPSLGSGPSVAPPASAPASPAATEDASAVYSLIRDQVEAIRGLEPTSDVEPVTIDETRLLENLEAEIDAEQTPEQLAISEDILATLGLIPEGSSLRELTLELLAGQVVGYYSPDRDELYVVSRSGGTVGPVERATYAHEFTHQLQDQSFDLGSLDTTSIDQSDRALAQLALIEGDASLAQFEWLFEHLTPAELGEVFAASEDPEAQAALDSAPAYLRDTAVFPYLSGLLFVQQLGTPGDYGAVDAAFADPPESTEQVLHPEKYLDREPPIEVRIGEGLAGQVGGGWSEAARDTLGELILRTWLDEHGVGIPTTEPLPAPSEESARATAGWGGDRLVLLRHDNGALAIAMSTTWDTAADAAEFAAAGKTALADPGFEGELFHRAGTRDVLIAIGDDAAAVLAALRG
jgi:hypothetical protein